MNNNIAQYVNYQSCDIVLLPTLGIEKIKGHCNHILSWQRYFENLFLCLFLQVVFYDILKFLNMPVDSLILQDELADLEVVPRVKVQKIHRPNRPGQRQNISCAKVFHLSQEKHIQKKQGAKKVKCNATLVSADVTYVSSACKTAFSPCEIIRNVNLSDSSQYVILISKKTYWPVGGIHQPGCKIHQSWAIGTTFFACGITIHIKIPVVLDILVLEI